MTTLATIPEYAPPGRDLTITVTPSLGNYVRFWISAAPEGSDFATQLKAAAQVTTAAPRVEWKTYKIGDPPLRHNFDKGGAYVFIVQEYTLGETFSGGYEGAPETAPTETKIGSEATASVYIGQRMTCRVGTPQDSAELVLWVWNATIRPTAQAVHGEATPAIVSPSSRRAFIASKESNVTTAVAALANAAVSTAIGTLVTVFKSIVTEFNDHIALTSGSVHAETNNFAAVPPMYESATKCTPEGVGALIRSLRLHLNNDENDPTGTGAVGPGSSTAHGAADSQNMPLVTGASEDDMVAAVADCWRCYEAHRVALSSVHGGADSTNTATALPALMTVHRYFFASLASQSPATPPGSTSGATLLAQLAGFKEA